MTIELGIVGMASFYSHFYAQEATASGRCRVGAVVPDRTDDQLRALGRQTTGEFTARHDCRIEPDVKTMLEDQAIDAVVVSSPSTRRAQDAVNVLESGRPVLTGKPAAATADGADRIAEAAEAASVPAVTTAPHRFDDAVRGVRRRIADGVIGEVIRARASVSHTRPSAEGIEYSDGHATDEVGTVYTMGYYTADALLWLIEEDPLRVTGATANRNTSYQNHPDIGSATVEFEEGILGTMTITMASDHGPRYGWDVEVVGTDGMLRTDHLGHEGVLWSGENRRTAEVYGRTLDPVLEKTFEAFIDSVGENAGPSAVAPAGPTVGDAIAVCETWERAAESGGVAEYRR